MRLFVTITLLSALVAGCHPGVRLGDLSKLSSTERAEAQSNWESVEKAFRAKDQQTLEKLIGRSVLLKVDASGSPWTGKVLSLEERAASARDFESLSGATGERASHIAKGIRERRDKAELVDCTIDFTRRQVRQHFIWPDAVFSAEFELVGTLSKASISTRSIRVTPVAIQPVIVQL